MSVEPLFGHSGVKLLVDPATRRVVYVAYNGVLPERVLIVDAGRQYLFAPASACEVVDFSGELPGGMSPQTCWGFRVRDGGLEPVVEEPVPARRTG